MLCFPNGTCFETRVEQRIYKRIQGRLLAACLLGLVCSRLLADSPVHVLVWDERQPRQAEAYDNFLGNEIVEQLKRSDGLEFRSVSIDDPDQGLSAGNLEWADVIIWWGHVRQNQVTQENADRILLGIRRGDFDLIALHSAHWARPFTAAMRWRSISDAKQKLAQVASGKKLTTEVVEPPREFTVPIHGAQRTPSVFGYKKSPKHFHAVIHLPYCCFPDYRPDGKPGTLRVVQPNHPIAQGLPKQFDVPQTEMYNEPFHVPEPDEVVFRETWERGETFRSGMVWKIEKGRVFYFRPGHETYPVYKQAHMLKVLENACRWLGK